ncbi:MAG TPA: hypothetical protein PKA33_15945 [Amaricoccus sp.]|uniref:hypothetical protein n=1 Tax=Amaricoccus sp. TaxID=1872485 RepID=UPI002C3E83BD|nr:hypothetical protein [Amaricoccus sp.]HMQ92504.1 hypothetical protein [Amaricoccus sp.]HMR53847.1 hypothetical protein [Amaricoccus sp.]HMR58964.1 hypothetical protein [Amaricoccus sp.]HMU00842.1 hypothetical protein [Amaricoccus sp.]
MLDLTPLRRALIDAYLTSPVPPMLPAEARPQDIIPAQAIRISEDLSGWIISTMTKRQALAALRPQVDARLTTEERAAFRGSFRYPGYPEQTIHATVWRIAMTMLAEIHAIGPSGHGRIRLLSELSRLGEVA